MFELTRLRQWIHPVVVVLVCAMPIGAVRSDDFADGVDAYVKGDYETAYSLWKPLADGEDPVAMFNIGVLHAQGLGTPPDPQTASQWYQRAARGGYAPAQFNLGVAYLQGLGVQKDPVQARDWFLLAAEQDHLQAQYNLGSLYWQGLGVESDPASATQWFQKAADGGDERAVQALALLRSELHSSPQAPGVADPPPAQSRDTESAREDVETVPLATAVESPETVADTAPTGWIARQPPEHFTVQLFADRVAEGALHFMEKHDIADMARFTSSTGWHKVVAGSFTTREKALAAVAVYPEQVQELKPWVRRMDEVQGEVADEPMTPLPVPPAQPSPAVQSPPAATADSGTPPAVTPPPAKMTTEQSDATPGSNMSLEQRLAAAQQALGDEDFVMAHSYWEPLAQSGQPEAQYGLGFLYESGLGLTRSDKSAFDWYRQAAEQGHPRAQFNLGILYMEGRGVVPNEGLGLYWIQSAADKSDVRAKEYLTEFRANLSATHDE